MKEVPCGCCDKMCSSFICPDCFNKLPKELRLKLLFPLSRGAALAEGRKIIQDETSSNVRQSTSE